MTDTQRLNAALTTLETASALLLDGVHGVAPVETALSDAIGGVAAELPKLAAGLPPFDIAMTDGWAMCARDLAGVSSYAPLPLTAPPVWVEAGERLPDGCDCVIDESSVERSGPLSQVIAEAIPGEGVRRAGEDFVANGAMLPAGRQVMAADLIVLRAAGRDSMPLRRPHVQVVGVPAGDGRNVSVDLITALAREAGARVTLSVAPTRDAGAIASVVGNGPRDLLLLVGGSGVGRGDAAVAALATCGKVAAHGLALQPGRTAAVGRIGATPVVVVPGAPASALSVWFALARPALDRLALHKPRAATIKPLARKIASPIGFAELVLLKATDGQWMPLAAGDLPLGQIVAGDAWLIVPGDSEGFAEGTHVGALPLRDIA
jgi:molybdopterin molybdotransferase